MAQRGLEPRQLLQWQVFTHSANCLVLMAKSIAAMAHNKLIQKNQQKQQVFDNYGHEKGKNIGQIKIKLSFPPSFLHVCIVE